MLEEGSWTRILPLMQKKKVSNDEDLLIDILCKLQRARTGDGSFLLLGARIPFETIQMEYSSVTCKVYLSKRSSSLETFFFFSNGKILV